MKKIWALLHIHRYNTPIASEYVSFNTRRIIYQCKCGCKKEKNVYIPFESNIPFPIPTASFLTRKEFEKILKDPNPIPAFLTPQSELDYIVK